MRRGWIISGVFVAIFTIVGGGSWWLWMRMHQDNQITDDSSDRTVPLSTQQSPGFKPVAVLSGPAGSNAPAASNRPGTVSQTNDGGNGLKVNPSGPSNTGRPSAPEAADFSQYDQYKEAQTALYGDLTAGNGPEVVAGSKVVVNYRGWLTNGQIFDETYTSGKPFGFTIGEHHVISGFENGLLGMKVGGKRRLIIPPGAGYGEQQVGSIPPHSVLVFDVELTQVQ